jgi:hypothetical protein
MGGITQVTTCKGFLDSVKKNLPRWFESGVDQIVIVDWACPEKVAEHCWEYVKQDSYRLKVLRVPPETAGETFHLTRARNLGAKVADNDILFFCDADAFAFPHIFDDVRSRFSRRNNPVDLLVADKLIASESYVHHPFADVPMQWGLHGQCFIRQSTFHSLNGYAERHKEWGGESYDLYIRSGAAGKVIESLKPCGIHVTPHSDTVRDRYLPRHFAGVDGGRRSQFCRSINNLMKYRRNVRANPGIRSGQLIDIGVGRHAPTGSTPADASPSRCAAVHASLVRERTEMAWIPDAV